jgi:hypothetical protein
MNGHIDDKGELGTIFNKGMIIITNLLVVIHTNKLAEFFHYEYENFIYEPIKILTSIAPMINEYLTSPTIN